MDDSDRLSAVRTELRRRWGEERFALWFGPRARAALAAQGAQMTVSAQSDAELNWLRRKLGPTLVASCLAATGAASQVVFEISPPPKNGGGPADQRSGGAAEPAGASPRPAEPPLSAPAEPRPAPRCSGGAPPRRSFETFVVGAGNQLAARAAGDAVRHPGRFTPLTLYGPPGCGKTHLLSAIELALRTTRPRSRSLVLTAEQFTAQFVEALDRRLLPGFRQKARSLDVLLVDDVQFFAGKRATIDELLFTLDALQARGGQVVLAGDAAPAELAAASPELAQRVAAGLSVGIEPPDFQTRRGIVRRTAERVDVTLDEAVVDLIARQAAFSGRMIGGALNRLVAVSMATGRPITLELAETALAEFCRQHVPQVRLADIQRAVSDVFGVEGAALRSARRSRSAAEPRMLAMWLARRYTRAALSEIGEYFGGRSHSTVASAKKKFDGLVSAGGSVLLGNQSCHIEEAVRQVEARLRSG